MDNALEETAQVDGAGLERGISASPAVELKRCVFCAEAIQAAALKCRHCGELQTQALRTQAAADKRAAQAPPFSPGIAALLSLIIPGAGQMYKGQVLNGLAWFLFVICGYAFFVIPGLVLHLFCVLGAASVPK